MALKKKNSKLVMLGENIREIRKNKRVNQDDFGTIDRSTIGRLERGELNPTFLLLEKIAKRLKVSIADLFRGI